MNRRRVRVSVRTRAALVASATVLVALLVGGVALVRIVESHLIDADRTAAALQSLAADFGMLGVQGTLCEGVAEIPAGIGEWTGPITSWSLIVPGDSSQTSISAEAAFT